MARQPAKTTARERKNPEKEFPTPQVKIDAKTPRQKALMNAIRTSDITVTTGPAGTGKTFICLVICVQMLMENKIDKIVMTRPAVSLDEEHGFVPGTLDEKTLVWMTPFVDTFEKLLGKSFYEYLLKVGRISFSPLAYIRGRSIDNAVIVMDECQNATVNQVITVATRIGENTRLVIAGDTMQADRGSDNGLVYAKRVFSKVDGVACVDFDSNDIVRSGICQRIVKAVEADRESRG